MKIRKSNFQTYNLATVNARALLNNVEILKQPGYQLIPVLKSNAYGTGIKEVAQILGHHKDVAMFAVDAVFEAEVVTKYTKKPVLIISPTSVDNMAAIKFSCQLRFEVQSLAELKAFGEINKKCKIHLKFNTGMNRLGFPTNAVPQILQLLKQYPKLEVEGVMTHLASPELPEEDAKQIAIFDNIVEKLLAAGLKPKFIHPTATVGSYVIKSKYANAARTGIGLYGIDTDGLAPGLQPVLKIQSTITHISELKKGDKVSYSGTFTATKPMKVAAVPFGYYDGLPRCLSNRGEIGGYPILGRVCMNITMIDITDKQLKVGDQLTILSDNPDDKNSARNIAKMADTIEYEILVRFRSTIRRRIV